jgi:hypothetical protein
MGCATASRNSTQPLPEYFLLKDRPGDSPLREMRLHQTVNLAAMPDKLSAKILRALVRGLCLNVFHSLVGGTNKATKKIRFRLNLLPIIEKIYRERAKPQNTVQARA